MLSVFGFGKKKKLLNEAYNDGAIIVDVRTPQEYKNGHIKGSMNIPLNDINARTSLLKNKGKTIITCCQSGMRSKQAANVLKYDGIPVINGGGWASLRNKLDL